MKTADINEHFVTVKTADLRGLALDWAVAKALNEPVKLVNFIGRMCLVSSNDFFDSLHLLPPTFSPSTDRAMAMTIVERFGIDLQCNHSDYADDAAHTNGVGDWVAKHHRADHSSDRSYGRTATEAALLCCVSHEFGREIQLPRELWALS